MASVRRVHGFTLLEVLVVLIIVSLVGVLLMQGLSHAFAIRGRLQAELREQQRGSLIEAWFRQTVRSLAPTEPFEGKPFAGSADRFEGISFAPLQGSNGSARRVGWSLIRSGSEVWLEYAEEGTVRWRLRRVGSAKGEEPQFHYLDSEGRLHRRWPPEQPVPEVLPAGIALVGAGAVRPLMWVQAIDGRKRLRLRYEEQGL